MSPESGQAYVYASDNSGLMPEAIWQTRHARKSHHKRTAHRRGYYTGRALTWPKACNRPSDAGSCSLVLGAAPQLGESL